MTLFWTIFERVLIAMSIVALILLFCGELIAQWIAALTSWLKHRYKTTNETFQQEQERNNDQCPH